MDDDDLAVEWVARRRRRNFLVSGAASGAVGLMALVATLLGVGWAAGFFGSFAGMTVVMFLRWRGERRAGRDHTPPFQ